MSKEEQLVKVNIDSKAFGNELIFSKLQMSLKEGEIISIFGPSGCGKTTLLRMIAGLESAIDNEIQLPKNDDFSIGFIFQKPILYPHLNVGKNILLGSKQKLSRDEKSTVLKKSLAMINLSGYDSRKITTLSGGESQRVALARALLAEPNLILLDEPFSSLDVEARRQLAKDVKEILKQNNVAAIHVSHDIEEAKIISDRILLWEEICTPNSTSNNNEDVQR
tara:strand:- start:4180 stop:4845 length:666 start_codon:yes stop_codon:yes gene_type:complete